MDLVSRPTRRLPPFSPHASRDESLYFRRIPREFSSTADAGILQKIRRRHKRYRTTLGWPHCQNSRHDRRSRPRHHQPPRDDARGSIRNRSTNRFRTKPSVLVARGRTAFHRCEMGSKSGRRALGARRNLRNSNSYHDGHHQRSRSPPRRTPRNHQDPAYSPLHRTQRPAANRIFRRRGTRCFARFRGNRVRHSRLRNHRARCAHRTGRRIHSRSPRSRSTLL